MGSCLISRADRSLLSTGTLELLWTNPQPTKTFSAQTISLNLTEYDGVVVTSKWGNNDDAVVYPTNQALCIKGSSALLEGSRSLNSYNSYGRAFSCDNSGVIFRTGKVSGGDNNSACIPLLIYGFKFQGSSGSSTSMDLLYRNASPGTAVAAHTVTLTKSAASYKFLLMSFRIIYNRSILAVSPVFYNPTSVSESFVLNAVRMGSIFSRGGVWTSSTQIAFETGYIGTGDGNGSKYVIPYEIWGVN